MPFGLKNGQSDLSAFGRQGILKADQAQPGGICRRLGHKKPYGRRNYLRHSRNIQNSPANKHEVESKKIWLIQNARGDDSWAYLVNADGLKSSPDKAVADGSSCIDGSGAGLILTNLEGVEFTYSIRFRFEATNNEAEYEALIAGVRIAEPNGR
ncbi:reverse transcriptase domain-containing protein [Tanacetum coccineum]